MAQPVKRIIEFNGFNVVDIPDYSKIPSKAVVEEVYKIEHVTFDVKIVVEDVKVKDSLTKCLGAFIICRPCKEKAELDWSCVVSAEVRVGETTRKFNHKFTSKETEWGFANFTPWADIIIEQIAKPEYNKRLLVMTKVKALPLKIEEEAKPKDNGTECIEKYMKLKTAKANELEYLYNPNTEANKNKNMSKQWNMAIRTLDAGIEDLKKELTREKEGGKNENKILKITLLEKELQILKMKFDSLMKEHIPVAKHLLWPSMPHQEKDLVLKTQTALVKDVLEPLRDLCPIKDYGKCKDCRTTLVGAPLTMPCVLKISKVGDSMGEILKVGFLLLLKHEDTRFRLESIDVFRKVFLPENSPNSDVIELKNMTGKAFLDKVKELPQYKALLELATLLVLAIHWLVNLGLTELIKLVKCFFHMSEGNLSKEVITNFELSYLGDSGACGLFFEILHLIMLCLKGNYYEFLLHFWKFDTDSIKPLGRISLSSPNLVVVDKNFVQEASKVYDRLWFSKSWLPPQGSDSCIKPTPPGTQPCSVCQRPGMEYYNYLDRREFLDIPVVEADFAKWQVCKRWTCNLSCNVGFLSSMLPNLNYLRERLNKDISWDNELSADLKTSLYKNWSELKYLMLRRQLRSAFVDKNLCVEDGKVIRMSESRVKCVKEKYLSLQNGKENFEYVNKLLVHDNSFMCEHKSVWKGTVDLDKPDKIIGVETHKLGKKTFELFACPSVDMLFVDHLAEWTEKEKLPWTWKGETLSTASAFTLDLGGISSKYLKNACWKLFFKGDLSSLEKKHFKLANSILLVFSPDFNITTTRAVVLVRTQESRWVVFVPRDQEELWLELRSVTYSNDSFIQSNSVLRADEVISLLDKENAVFLTNKAVFQDPAIRDQFHLVHKKSGKSRNLPAVQQLSAAKPFAASHLVGCPHRMMWRGRIVMLGITRGTQVRRLPMSGWAFECSETLRTMTKNPAYKQRNPPPRFWASMPDELVLIQTHQPYCSNFLDVLFDGGYNFVLDIGTIPLEFFGGLEEDENFWVSGFLFQDQQLEFSMCVRLVRSVGKVVVSVFRPDDSEFTSDGARNSLGSKLWCLTKAIVDRRGFKGTPGLFKPRAENGSSVVEIEISPTSASYELQVLMEVNSKKIVADTATGSILWTGPMHFLFVFCCGSEKLTGLEKHTDYFSKIKIASDGYDLVFNDEVGAIKNSAFNTDSAHQAYGLEGCVTGTLPAKDFNLFNIKSTKHTFVALRVSKKLVDPNIARFKKCWVFNFHLQDNQYIYKDIQQDHIYLFGFFLPQGVTVPTYLKNFEDVVNKFLILKYDERMNALVGYYPRDLQRRSQLLTALLGKDAMSLSAHINKFNSKKKKEEEPAALAAPISTIEQYIEEKKKDGTFSDVKVTKTVEGNKVSLKYTFERVEDEQMKLLNALKQEKPVLKRVKLEQKPTKLNHVTADGRTIVEDTVSGEKVEVHTTKEVEVKTTDKKMEVQTTKEKAEVKTTKKSVVVKTTKEKIEVQTTTKKVELLTTNKDSEKPKDSPKSEPLTNDNGAEANLPIEATKPSKEGIESPKDESLSNDKATAPKLLFEATKTNNAADAKLPAEAIKPSKKRRSKDASASTKGDMAPKLAYQPSPSGPADADEGYDDDNDDDQPDGDAGGCRMTRGRAAALGYAKVEKATGGSEGITTDWADGIVDEILDTWAHEKMIPDRATGGGEITPDGATGGGDKEEEEYEPELPTCWTCYKDHTELGFKLKKCAGCHVAKYCGKECQEEDWFDHEDWCREEEERRAARRERKEARAARRRAREERDQESAKK